MARNGPVVARVIRLFGHAWEFAYVGIATLGMHAEYDITL